MFLSRSNDSLMIYFNNLFIIPGMSIIISLLYDQEVKSEMLNDSGNLRRFSVSISVFFGETFRLFLEKETILRGFVVELLLSGRMCRKGAFSLLIVCGLRGSFLRLEFFFLKVFRSGNRFIVLQLICESC